MTPLCAFRSRPVVCALAALLAVVGAAVPTWAQFETRATNKFPSGAFSIAAGDFNNDGKLDVVMITDNGFTVALGNGDGTFQKPVTTETELCYSLAVADFNDDGNLDIVVANLVPSTVGVYLGNGDGTFKPPVNSNTTEGSYFVVVGDFNSDKIPDVAIIDPPYISVLLGNGDGTFRPPSDNNSFVGGAWLAVADFNNDHSLDVLVTGSFGSTYSVGVLLGNGNGTLQDSITKDIEYAPATVAAGDLNGDGKMDAVLGYDLGGVAVLLGNGDGTLQHPVNYSTTGPSYYVLVSDLNLNGKLDVVVPSTDGTAGGVDVFWGNGEGTLEPAQFFASAVSGPPVVGDFNGDGLPDFALGNEDYGVGTMLNTGVVSFSPSTAPLTFPVQVIDTASSKQTVNLTNNGAKALSISSMKLSGQFQMSDTCGKSVASGASCSVTAVFKPKSAGNFTGLITIVDSASSKPQFVELTGSATVVKVAPAALRFGDQKVGTASSAQTVTATNEGSTAITFYGVGLGKTAEKNFTATENCTGHAIQPGASCSASVTFAPTQNGAVSGELFFTLPANSVSPAPVVLSGTGTT